MRTSATGISTDPDLAMPRSRGFTLIELLVVLVIGSILTAAAIGMLRYATRDDDAATEASRIASLADMASEEALLTGQEFGLRISDRKLQFLLFNDQTRIWTVIEDDKLFKPRDIPEHIELHLSLDGQTVEIADPESEGPKPQVVFYSSGQTTPFELTVIDTRDNDKRRITGNLLGKIDVTKADAL